MRILFAATVLTWSTRMGILLGSAALSAFSVEGNTIAKQRADIEGLKNSLIAKDVEIASLKRQIESSAIAPVARKAASPIKPEEVETVAAEPALRPSMCYKDYCPCDTPQDGPDQVLCDQLEEGVEVDVQMMIAGRGMREARRQLREADY